MENQKENTSVNIETKSVAEPEEKRSDVKTTVIQSIALLLCAALVIVTLSTCFSKRTQNNNDIAEKYASAQGEGGAQRADAPVDDPAVPDDGVLPEDTAPADEPAADTASEDTAQPSADEPASPSADTPAAQTPATTAAGAQKAAPAPTASAPATTAEILSYFNTAINKVKPQAKSVTQTLEKNYQAKSIDLGSLGAMKGVVNKLIDSNMGVNKDKTGVTATTAAEKNKLFPVENETWSSKLTMDDIKSASLKESGGVYTITILVKDDAPAATIRHGGTHHAKAFSVVMPDTIRDNAGAASGFLKDLKVGNSDGKIVVKVDKATGHVTAASYDFVWSLGVSSFGGVTAYFGIIQEFTIKW